MDWIVTASIRILETMFAVGAIGSAIVLVLSGIEDIETLLGTDKPDHV